MSDNVFLNADRTEVVDFYSPGKKWQISRKEAQRLGFLGDSKKEPQARRVGATGASFEGTGSRISVKKITLDSEDVIEPMRTDTPRKDRQRRRSVKK